MENNDYNEYNHYIFTGQNVTQTSLHIGITFDFQAYYGR